MFRERIEKKH